MLRVTFFENMCILLAKLFFFFLYFICCSSFFHTTKGDAACHAKGRTAATSNRAPRTHPTSRGDRGMAGDDAPGHTRAHAAEQPIGNNHGQGIDCIYVVYQSVVYNLPTINCSCFAIIVRSYLFRFVQLYFWGYGLGVHLSLGTSAGSSPTVVKSKRDGVVSQRSVIKKSLGSFASIDGNRRFQARKSESYWTRPLRSFAE